MKKLILAVILASITLTAKDFTVTSNIGTTMLQQQVKDEVGGRSYPVLYNYTELNLNMEVRYNISEYLSAGAYVRYDFGNRQVSDGVLHGNGNRTHINFDYNESWVGPIVKGHYKDVFLGLGYGLLATRNDGFLGITYENPGFFQGSSVGNEVLTTSSIAWLVQLGGKFELSENLDLNLFLEYRVRYYDKVNDLKIKDGYVIGTQNITPMAGISYNFDL